ncbi:hypothetical protein TBLA_0B04990 [Henningerozyma blattae CBS 6284]|uniref:Superkiller protein 3 n=1 Tax=Henningerozyma blattae (strain ATCC 34711 / CBS 6284 / DSM 70876 / NBRC 10599 / NRRL Y-10934 / UCD 77-7) TaxID=1071380 RepID=I2GYY2_HENB6|nr:hypothetical protein TBLA_0B04990 [Tetrapisispora blattae CBS 6284]CCH59334.1 hypothetical protein TBLA_0B04990 [Tetrapisispora blattae CBS 6284]
MSDIKQLLKEAKKELAREDYEEAIIISKKVLKKDPNNYFANVFLGKSYSCIQGKTGESLKHYLVAIDSNSSSMLAWKGLFLVLKEPGCIPDNYSFDEYFDLCGKYAECLFQQELPMVDLIHDLRMMKKSNPACLESFLKHLKPGTPLAERLGHHLMTPQTILQELIKLIGNKEQEAIAQLVSRERLKLSTADPLYQIKINSIAWEIYEDSEMDDLYSQLVNITNDDDTRAKLEESWLQYRIKVLKSMPSDIKLEFCSKVKAMVEDMVLVNHESLTAWKYYFEWQDYDDIDNMELELIIKFFKKFPTEPFAMVLYAWVSSNLSKYDVRSILFTDNTDKKNDIQATEEEQEVKEATEDIEAEESMQELMETDDNIPALLEKDVLTALLESISKVQSSALSHRIISKYFLLTNEYEAALSYIKTGISLIAYNIRDLGIPLHNSKLEVTLDLGTVYTYVDAPKNHNAALSLFEKIISEDPGNARAKMGKGIIFMERENWNDANNLLKEVTEEFPDNLEILSELGWSEANLGRLDPALIIFDNVLTKLEGTDIRTTEIRALNTWRKAKTLIFKQMLLDAEKDGMDNVKNSFKLLIQTVKMLDTYAPAFSLLGHIYSIYYLDNARAFKCYNKAFELNPGDIEAAKYMTSKYADNQNWTAAAIVAERLVKSEKAKKGLKRENWPYRVIGISYLEKQQAADSIEWFQSAIRVDDSDVESWVGLGQSYYSCGRIEASIKVFEKPLELSPHHPHALYFKALGLSDVGQFVESIEILEYITDLNPNNEAFKICLAKILVKYATDLFTQGFLMKAIATATKSISIIESLVTQMGCTSQNLWVLLSSALNMYLLVSSQSHEVPLDNLISIFSSIRFSGIEELDDIDEIIFEHLLEDDKGIDNNTIICTLLILSSKYALSSSDFESLSAPLRSSLWYNIGLSELTSYILLNEDKFRDAAIYAFKKSIKFQSNTTSSWIGLGIATMDINYRVSQHCFIKASALEPRDTEIWFNLSMLSLKNNDTTFAKQVLDRTQSIAPQESTPWLGLALLHELEGNRQESSRLFAHAFVLSNGRSKNAQLLYAKNVLENYIGKNYKETDIEAVEQLSTISNGLDQYFKKVPDDPFALQCALLSLERLHMYSLASEYANKLSVILENRFENSQEESELINFAHLKAQLARIELGSGNYTTAAEHAELSLGLLDGQESLISSTSILSNYIVLGLANFFLDKFDETLTYFQKLLEISKESKYVVILISKVLYEVGSADSKEIALEELTEYIGNNGPDISITLTLAVISIIENKKEDLHAILQELYDSPLSDLIVDKQRNIPYLIDKIKRRISKETPESQKLRTMQKMAVLFPNDFKLWESLDKKICQRVSCDGQNKVTAEQLSNAYANVGNLRSIQRSIFLTPWETSNLQSLAGCFV